VTLDEFQQQVESIYFERDSARGLAGTFMWFLEEVGELAHALRRGEGENLKEDLADVLAWLSTLASISGVRLGDAARRYAQGCPYCHHVPCSCPPANKP
jgi:NTP pyrophosphatase (non-canonical NTP hydrolase)